MKENLTMNVDLESEKIEKLKDFMWTFVYPNICVFGTLTNLVNICIFMRSEFKHNSIHKLMLAYSISDFFYLFICCFTSLAKCGSFCRLDDSFSAQIYGQVFIDYTTSVLAIFNILIELFVSLQRYMAVKNVNFLQKASTRHLLFTIFIFSIVFYLPVLFTKSVVQKNWLNQMQHSENHTIYTLEITEFGKSVPGKVLVLALSFFRNVVCLGLILVFSVLTMLQFRKYLNNKMNIRVLNNARHKFDSDKQEVRMKNASGLLKTNELNVNRNLTVTVIAVSAVFIVGHIPYAIAFIVSILRNEKITYTIMAFRAFCFVMLFTAHGVNLIVYYFSNKIYRNLIKKMLREVVDRFKIRKSE